MKNEMKAEKAALDSETEEAACEWIKAPGAQTSKK